MRICRQLLAAGLLLAAAWGGPGARLPYWPLRQAQAQNESWSAAATNAVYIPLFARAASHDLAISRVEVIQGVTLGDSYTVHVAGRPALLRVFAALSGGTSLAGVTARARLYVGGLLQDELTLGPLTVNAVTNEGNLSHTFNFALPTAWLAAGSSYVVELDSANSIAETNESNNRYPAAGEQSFNYQVKAPLNVVIVPVRYRGIDPPTSNLGYLTWMPIKVLPVSSIVYTVRSTPHVFNGDLKAGSGWSQLLGELNALHNNEDPAGDKLYYGLVDSAAADGCNPSCITGIGYINSPGIVHKTAAGFAGFPGSASGRDRASSTFTHEMGHNFGRRHAPCGNPAGADGAFPYANAVLGQWGYDNATGQLYNPSTNHDYMSYCGPEWTSDYTYFGIAQAWGWLNAAAGSASAAEAAQDERLVISGFMDEDGTAQVDPVYRAAAGQMGTNGAAATHRLEMLDAKGNVLRAIPFGLAEVVVETPGEATHLASFSVLADPAPGLAGLRLLRGDEVIYERFATGAAPALAAPTAAGPAAAAEGGTRVSWALAAGDAGTRYRVRFSPDGGETWQVLVLDGISREAEVPAAWLAGAAAPVVEVQASDGLRLDSILIPIQ